MLQVMYTRDVHGALKSPLMKLQFADAEVAALCCSLQRLTARWGSAGGEEVGRRLLQIKAAPDIAALQTLPGRCRRDGNNETWLIDVDGVATITFLVSPEVPATGGQSAMVHATVTSIIDRSSWEGRP
jgi:hypothetical protein